MRVPGWLTLGVALLVCLFGLYRIRLAFRAVDDADTRPRRGIYAMGKRTHALIGIVYLLLGGALIATSFGWNPFAGSLGPKTSVPSKDAAPSKAGVPIDQLPSKK